MAGFGRAFGAFAGGAAEGYDTQQKRESQGIKDDILRQQQGVDAAYGNTLASIFGGADPADASKMPWAPKQPLFQRIGSNISDFLYGDTNSAQQPTYGASQDGGIGGTPMPGQVGDVPPGMGGALGPNGQNYGGGNPTTQMMAGAPVPASTAPEGPTQIPQHVTTQDRSGRQYGGSGTLDRNGQIQQTPPAPGPVQATTQSNMQQAVQQAQQPMAPVGAQPQQQARTVTVPAPGTLTLDQIVSRVRASNPGAPPAVIAGAVERFRPWMNDQSKQQWQQMQMDLRQQGLDLREQQIQQNEGYRGERLKQIDRAEQGRNTRAQTQEEGRMSRAEQAEAGRSERATLQEEGRNTRFQQQQGRLTSQFDRRFQQAETRLQQARSISDRAAAIRELEAAQREYRDGALQQLNANRFLVGPERQAEIARIQRQMETSSARINALRSQARGGNPQGTPGSPYGGLTSTDTGASYPDRDLDQGQLERSGTVQSGRRDAAGQKTTDRVPSSAPTASAAPPAAATLPPEVASRLKEGAATRFSNGQIWTLRDGQPVRVQ